MRHQKSGRKFSRTSAHREAMFRNMAASLIKHGLIRTTLPKAKELRRVAEPLITLAKVDGVANRRLAFDRLRDKAAVGVLFDPEAGGPGRFVRTVILDPLGLTVTDAAAEWKARNQPPLYDRILEAAGRAMEEEGIDALRLDRVDLYNAADFKLVARVPAAKTPSHMAFDKASQFVFITLQDSNEVLAIDLKTRQPAWRHPVGLTPAGIHMTPDDRYLLVGIMGADYVEVIDWRARKTVTRIVTARGAHNFLPRGDGRHVFVSNRTINGSISLVDMQDLRVVERYDVPGGPDDMEIRADGKELWATARFARKVQVVNLEQKQLSHSIRVGRSPHGVSFINHAGRQ